jgi:hypothetical protein
LADPTDEPDLYLKAKKVLDDRKAVGVGLLHPYREVCGRIRAEARRVAEELEG